jgi:hypothetical protein
MSPDRALATQRKSAGMNPIECGNAGQGRMGDR